VLISGIYSYHYSFPARRLCVNMPTFAHESFSRNFDDLVRYKFRERGADSLGLLYVASGSTTVKLDRGEAAVLAAGTNADVPTSYQPDASWCLIDPRNPQLRRPGLVVEVCATQKKQDAMKKAKFYLGSTKGEVRCVIIVDLVNKNLVATVSVCVADHAASRSKAGKLPISRRWLAEDEVWRRYGAVAPIMSCS
jgi:hypothetical protein